MIDHINFVEKLTGKRSAGNPHAAFDVAGAGNAFDNQAARQFSTLLVREVKMMFPKVEYCDTLHTERGEKQGIQSIPKGDV